MKQPLKWWLTHHRVRSVGPLRLVGTIVHVLPSGSALVQWDRDRERRYVDVGELAPWYK